MVTYEPQKKLYDFGGNVDGQMEGLGLQLGAEASHTLQQGCFTRRLFNSNNFAVSAA